MHQLFVYNSLTRQREEFKPVCEGKVGMYVCGPTVYSDVHLGNCRTFTSFDVIYRVLKYLGYKVRYVRNITDVGHLEGDADIGREDKIAKKARLDQLEPMEVVQKYANGFQQMMETFNLLPPDIEPRATGHIIEQIEMIQAILERGLAYVKNGSVYFDTPKYIEEKNDYGVLSGRVVEDLLQESRELKGQEEKNHPSDFALWIQAGPSHLMRWPSPWSTGFPGWHLECSAMSTKYLGTQFDIHGGGNDLKFPHHENEIAQNVGACGETPARYWLHTNMLLLNGRKMSKSEDNSVTPQHLFSGDSKHFSKAFSPMVVRFFMLQAHYRSTLDLTDEALVAAEKGYKRLMQALKTLTTLEAQHQGDQSPIDQEILALMDGVVDDMCDDFNTPRALAGLFELTSKINGLSGKQLSPEDLSIDVLNRLKKFFPEFIGEVLGLKDDTGDQDQQVVGGLMELIIDLRKHARLNKDWGTADKIRDSLTSLSIQLKDGKEGTSWIKS